ncbi:hypothetical protein HMPREF3038_02763 [Akkermansia sp. KLE1797]|nr:hypothetical protein HMPREF3038_02763 [Akkermansia sp. KLE1797]KXU53135.1 hypothetical protein HMPREF3039_02691 [Akkermansia sp. KLE1798]KZA03775.1 hypothetical protein HMPREF1326_02548 [Akkermansia sp. KLE1605]
MQYISSLLKKRIGFDGSTKHAVGANQKKSGSFFQNIFRIPNP